VPEAAQPRWGAAALAFAGVMFLLYPAVRPWHDETTVAGARESMASSAWVAAHFFAMLGFIAVGLAMLALRSVVPTRLAGAALITTWVGAGLTLPYYGAEDFGLHGAARSDVGDLVALADAVRFAPLAATTFAIGLLALTAGAILAALAVWRSGVVAAPAGVLYAVGFALFIPQFYLPATARIAHGVLLAAGCLWLAAALWRVPKGELAARPVSAVG
jgi:hypothetical protein